MIQIRKTIHCDTRSLREELGMKLVTGIEPGFIERPHSISLITP